MIEECSGSASTSSIAKKKMQPAGSAHSLDNFRDHSQIFRFLRKEPSRLFSDFLVLFGYVDTLCSPHERERETESREFQSFGRRNERSGRGREGEERG